MRRAATRFLLAALCATGLVADVACAEGFDHKAFATATIEKVLRPKSEAFSDAARQLHEAMQALCSKPSSAQLISSRDAFKFAVSRYAALELLRFGPTRQDNRQEKLFLYPDPKGLVRRQVEAVLSDRDASVKTAAGLAGKSVAVQGFSALELVLYGSGSEQLASPAAASEFRCTYAQSLSENIATLAAAIRKEWWDEAGFSRMMLNPSEDNPAYLEPREVTLEIVSAISNGFETVRDIRLAAPLGVRELKKAATPAPLATSGLMSTLLAGNVSGLRAAYQDSGLQAQLALVDSDLAGLVSSELTTAEQAATTSDTGKANALRDKSVRQSLLALGFPLKNAKEIFARLVADAAGLAVGFNAGDGD